MKQAEILIRSIRMRTSDELPPNSTHGGSLTPRTRRRTGYGTALLVETHNIRFICCLVRVVDPGIERLHVRGCGPTSSLTCSLLSFKMLSSSFSPKIRYQGLILFSLRGSTTKACLNGYRDIIVKCRQYLIHLRQLTWHLCSNSTTG